MQDGRQPGLQLTTGHRLSGEGTALAISDKCGTPFACANITTNRCWVPLPPHHAVATKILTLLPLLQPAII